MRESTLPSFDSSANILSRWAQLQPRLTRATGHFHLLPDCSLLCPRLGSDLMDELDRSILSYSRFTRPCSQLELPAFALHTLARSLRLDATMARHRPM